MAVTLDELKNATHGTVFIVRGKRWRVNGKVKRWKRDQDRVEIPVKHGLYAYDTLTGDDLDIIERIE